MKSLSMNSGSMKSETVLAAAIFLSAFCITGPAEGASIRSVSTNLEQVPCYARLEVTIELGDSYDNPYDPEQIQVDAEILGPSGTSYLVPAFYFEPYTCSLEGGYEHCSKTGEGRFLLRFAPQLPGDYEILILAEDDLGIGASPYLEFTALPSSRRGNVRVDPRNPRYLAYDDGTSYVPLGVNLDWAVEPEGVFSWLDYLHQMVDGGGNWTRLWMSHFSTGTTLEWGSDHWTGYYEGLGRYSQAVGAKLDLMLSEAEDLGVSLQLVLHQHSQFETGAWSSWADNPYNSENGGPCESSLDYFQNEEALRLQAALHRYIVARTHAYRSILAYEIFNEADLIDNVSPRVMAPWAREVAQDLRGWDSSGHLVTSSYASPIHLPGHDLRTWDFNNRHMYLYGSFMVGAGLRPWKMARKPLILAEFGIDTEATCNDQDPLGVNLHNGIWSSLMHGYAGGAMNWWWDSYINVYDLWSVNGPPRAFVEGEDMSRFTEDLATSAKASGRPLESAGLGATTGDLWVWVRDGESQWFGEMDDFPATESASIRLEGSSIHASRYEVVLFNTWTGESTLEQEAQAQAGVLTLTLPSFERDVALKLRPL